MYYRAVPCVLVNGGREAISTCPNAGLLHSPVNDNLVSLLQYNHYSEPCSSVVSPLFPSPLILSFPYFRLGRRQIGSRKKAVRMLGVVVFVFALSYLPVHAHNIIMSDSFPTLQTHLTKKSKRFNLAKWEKQRLLHRNNHRDCSENVTCETEGTIYCYLIAS